MLITLYPLLPPLEYTGFGPWCLSQYIPNVTDKHTHKTLLGFPLLQEWPGTNVLSMHWSYLLQCTCCMHFLWEDYTYYYVLISCNPSNDCG